MRITLKTGLLVGAGWFLIKLLVHVIQPMHSIKPLVFINMLLCLVAIAVGLYLHKKAEGFHQGNALSDIKAAMQSGIPYALIVSLSLYVYYAYVNPGFVEEQIHLAESTIRNALDDPKQFEEIKAQQEAFEVMSKEEIYRELVKSPRGFYSAGSTAIIAMLGLTLLSTLYSIFVTVIFRRVIFR